MTEELLDGCELRAGAEHVCGEGVPQYVWAHPWCVYVSFHGAVHDEVYEFAVYGFSGGCDEESVVVHACGFAPCGAVSCYDVRELGSEWDYPFFITLSEHF